MSLPKAKNQRTLHDVSMLVVGLFPRDNRYRLFRENVLPALAAKRNALCALYCEENGRPAVDPVMALGVTLLQFMEKSPDRQAAENVRLHLGWKYALDLEINEEGFHPTSLVNFRERLLGKGAERVGFDVILGTLREAGLTRKRSRQRLDSTHVLGCVAKMSRLECMRETIRLFIKQVKRWGLEARLPDYETYVERYCESQIQWHRLNKGALIQKAEQAGQDAWALLRWLARQSNAICEHDRAKLLRRVFGEQYELEADGVPRRKREVGGVVENPHDPEAQWSSKDLARTKTWVGYKTQVAETVSESDEAKKKGNPTEQFIAEVTTTEAIASDLDGMSRNLRAQAEHQDDQPSELYVDTAYVSGDSLSHAQAEGRELIGPARQPSKAGKNIMDADQFDVDTASRTAVCPAGHASRQCSLINDQYKGAAYLRYEWAGLCDECPLKIQCTRRKDGRRHLSVGVHHHLLQQRRREMQTETFRARMRRRNAIEGTLSEFTRLGGRRTRYRGLAKTGLANYFLGAAVNVNRWIRLLQWHIEQKERPAY